MEYPEVKERLLEFIKTMGLSVAQFERRAGLSNGYIRNFRGSFGGNKFDLILEAFPMLNREWVTTGRGEMMLPRAQTEAQQEAEQEEVVEEGSEAVEDVTTSDKGRVVQYDDKKIAEAIKKAMSIIDPTDWKRLYESSQREVETLKMLLDVSQQQVKSAQKQLDAALEQIRTLQLQLGSKH